MSKSSLTKMNTKCFFIKAAIVIFFLHAATLCTQPITNQQNTALAQKKWKLWSEGTTLRGANIWQRKVVPSLDSDFLGDGYIGPPFTQQDFDKLSKLGANYINLSVPGIYTEQPPYTLDTKALANLDDLIDKAERADLFVVITFRTGPGRSDFTFYRDGAGTWFPQELLIETVWQSQEAQSAWAAMWQTAAERYKNRKHVVAYDLMCEPNADDILFGIYDPSDYYPRYAGAIHDWNQFYPKLVKAIRSKDPSTPIIVSCAGWGNYSWLSYLTVMNDPYLVFAFHQYVPQGYTHQESGANISYPGKFDIDEDGTQDTFNKAWLEDLFNDISRAQKKLRHPLVCNEYGIKRYVPGAHVFINDELELMEQRGINHAIWMWYPAWEAWKDNAEMNDFNFRMTAAANQTIEADNPLLTVIKNYWARNTIRPSNW